MKSPLHQNRTGIEASPFAQQMIELEGIARTSDLVEEDLAEVRARAAEEADPSGSSPSAPDPERRILLDRLAGRLVFERIGVRLYEAVLAKLPVHDAFPGGPATAELTRLRNQEAEHAALLQEAVRAMGGDHTALSPCANLELVCSTGIAQVVTDARTDIGESLQAMLVAELADRDGWSALIALADDVGESIMADRFRDAAEEEEEHLDLVRGWLRAYQDWRLAGHSKEEGR